ncbi:MAG: porin family protein [Planctomycetes bacterium]|nr:porin family protein [Planctomycetota bacterium]
MRAIVLLALLLVGCRSRVAPPRESDLYGGVGVVGVPSVGGQVTAGQWFAKSSDKYDFAFELRAVVEAGDDSATQDGGFYQVQMGVKQVLSPGHDNHLFFRYGLQWFRANGDPAMIDDPGDYFGAYGGVGYEWRLGERWWIGPEATLTLADGEGNLGTEFLPQVGLNLFFDF